MTDGRRGDGAGQGRVPQPGRVREGPHRPEDGRGRRGVRRAEAGRCHRRADLGQHRCRPRAGRPAPGLLLHLRVPRQGVRGQAQRAQGLRRRGRRLPHGGRPRPPGLLLLHVRPPRPRDAGGVEARPVLQPQRPALALRDDRPRDLGRHRRPRHALRHGGRHRGHHLRRGTLPARGLGRPRVGSGHDRRGRPRGLGLQRRHRAALPRRGRRRGLLARGLRPLPGRRGRRGLGRRLVRR